MVARAYVAGYLDMTEWANPNIATNYTVGFFVLFGLVGATIGKAVEILGKRMSKEKRIVVQMVLSLLGAFGFAYLLSAVGAIEGFRFGQ